MKNNPKFVFPFQVLAVLIGTTTFGAEPANIDDYAKRSREERPAAIAATKAELASVRKSRRLKGAEKATEIARIEKLAADLENPLEPYYGTANFKVAESRIGDVGWVREEVTVHEISGDTIAVVTKTKSAQRAVYNTTQERVTTISEDIPTELLYIHGASLKGAKVDEPIKLDGLFIRTANGLEPADLSAHADKFTRKSEIRTWAAKSGGHTTEAIFVGAERGHMTLMNLDGKTTKVELGKLSDDDRDYVRKYISEQAKLAKFANRRR